MGRETQGWRDGYEREQMTPAAAVRSADSVSFFIHEGRLTHETEPSGDPPPPSCTSERILKGAELH